jgi:hypothetical protein
MQILTAPAPTPTPVSPPEDVFAQLPDAALEGLYAHLGHLLTLRGKRQLDTPMRGDAEEELQRQLREGKKANPIQDIFGKLPDFPSMHVLDV